jgi:hypothetical protein
LDVIRQQGADTVVCNENRLKNIPSNINVVNAEVYRIEGTWAAYKYNNDILDALWQKHKSKFVIRKINIRPAASKWIYWTNYRVGALEACANTLFPQSPVLNLSPYAGKSKLKEIVKYGKNFLENNWKAFRSNTSKTEIKITGKPQTGLLVNNDFEVLLYRYIIELLIDEDIIIFHYGNINFNHPFLTHQRIQFIDLSKLSYSAYQSPMWPFFTKKEELYMANILFQNWQSLSSEIARYELIKQTGISKIVINVGENLPLRNLMKPVFGDAITVFNTMNGVKSGEAHDADINFDKWFVWDQEMKNLLINDCSIQADKLLVSGHLSEDHIRHHQFENSIQLDLDKIKNKKIITVFSVRGNRKEKVDAFQLLYQMQKQHEDWFIIVKPHPLEKKADYIWPEDHNPNVIYIDESLKNSKSALFDLLHVSDLSLVFGSTVALESSWIKTPCITFEYRSVSFIHTSDTTFIQHLDSIKELENRLQYLEKKPILNNTAKDISVSGKIVEHLKN